MTGASSCGTQNEAGGNHENLCFDNGLSGILGLVALVCAFSAELGAGHLYVIAHGHDPRIAEICPGASIMTIPRDGFDNFDRNRARLLDGVHAGLAQVYDWVIRTDADELLCHDPALHGSLVEVFEKHEDVPVLTALGFDLVQISGDPALTGAPVLSERRHLAFSGHYSKAIAAKRPIGFLLHGVKVAPARLQGFPFVMARGLFLAHLKYANLGVLDEGNAVRRAVADAATVGGPGSGWSDAAGDAQRFQENFAAKKLLPWERAEQRAFETLSVKPSRIEKSSVVKTRALKLPFRTTLPARFGGQG